MNEPVNITQLLRRISAGDSTAEQLLFPLIYKELRRLAGAFFRHERPGHTLQPTALVNEVYLRLAAQETMDWQSRAHFFAVAASTMRRVLIDHIRKNRAAKRGAGGQRLELEDCLIVSAEKFDLLLAVDQALDRLAVQDERQARIVEMRFFGGLTEEEIGLLLGLCERTIKRDWMMAKAWLKLQLSAR